MIKKIFHRLPFINKLIADRDKLLAERDALLLMAKSQKNNSPEIIVNKDILPAFPNGHYYSPIPDFNHDLPAYKKYKIPPKTIPGINLNPTLQINTFHKLSKYYQTQPFTYRKNKKNLFYLNNPNILYGDAFILYAMIRYLKPKQIIEIGSGYSSCLMLDTNRLFFNNQIKLTFIEPYPDLLLNLTDHHHYSQILTKKVQDIDLSVFNKLEENDILFIDSSHVSKFNSDVNHILFNIIPSLKPKVVIHFHDIFYPFEYPQKWFKMGFCWNEDYVLKAFLEYNPNYQILFFNSYFYTFYQQLVHKHMPKIKKNTNSSLWLKKLV